MDDFDLSFDRSSMDHFNNKIDRYIAESVQKGDANPPTHMYGYPRFDNVRFGVVELHVSMDSVEILKKQAYLGVK